MLTLTFPGYTCNSEIEKMTIECLKSYKELGYKMVFVEDGGNYSSEIKDLVDTYIYEKKNKGFTGNVNRCLKYIEHGHIAVVSTDTKYISGNLDDLCTEKATSPIATNQSFSTKFKGCFFVLPKFLLNKYGYLDESMVTYYSDQEYLERLGEGNIEEIKSVVIEHGQAQTVKASGVEGITIYDKNAYDGVNRY